MTFTAAAVTNTQGIELNISEIFNKRCSLFLRKEKSLVVQPLVYAISFTLCRLDWYDAAGNVFPGRRLVFF